MLQKNTLFHEYRILEFLGAGGSGSVYRALQPGLDREVALKVVRVAGPGAQEERRRFLREARALAQLSHPGIVRIYDFGEEGDALYYSMEYAPGSSLDRAFGANEPLSQRQTCDVLYQVLDALQTVHELGVLHRDIKPANILIRPRGGVVLSDFGLARQQDATKLTRDGQLMGTLPYLPPEMFRMLPYTPRGDLYQTGVMAFELLTGHQPYTTQQVLGMLAGKMLEPGPAIAAVGAAIGPGMAAFLARAMAVEPEERYRSATEMKAELERVEAGEVPVPAAPVRRLEPAPAPAGAPPSASPLSLQAVLSPAWNGQRTALVLSALLWCGALCAGLWWWRSQPAPEAARAEPVATTGQVADPSAPTSELQPSGEADQLEQLRADLAKRLLDESELPLYVTRDGDGWALETVIPAAHELLGAELVWASGQSRRPLAGVNGTPVATGGASLPVTALTTGNNRVLLRGVSGPGPRSSPAALRIRRREGSSLGLVPGQAAPLPEAGLPAEAIRQLELVRSFVNAAKFDQALDAVTGACARYPDHWEFAWRRAMCLHYVVLARRGLLALTSGLVEFGRVAGDPETLRLEGMRLFGSTLATVPNCPEVWSDFGIVFRDFGRQADAERAFQLAVILERPPSNSRWELVRTLAARIPKGHDSHSEPMRLAMRVARLAFSGHSRFRADFLSERGTFFRRAGLSAEARRDYEHALEVTPGFPAARAGLGALDKD